MKNLWLFDQKRLSILKKLLECEEAKGCDLKQCFKMKKTLLSYHLGMLRERGILLEERQGREKCYRIRPQKIPLVKKIVSAVD